MTRRKTRTDLPYAAQKLRRLLTDSHMTAAALARIVNLPPERVRTLTRGNAPMRIDEAERIALAFGRRASVFFEKDNTEQDQRNQYVIAHRAEIRKFQEALETASSLQDSFKMYSEQQAHKSAPPKYCYYDGTMGKASAIVAKETQLIDTLFNDIEYLSSRDTILLAGSRDYFGIIATAYMRRWWVPQIYPGNVATIKMDEDKERERCRQYRDLMTAFSLSKAFKESYNPARIELEQTLAETSLATKPETLRQAEQLYCRSLTILRMYEYCRFYRALMVQSSKKGTIFGDTLRERIIALNKLGVLHTNKMRASLKATGITPIRAGYNTTTHKMSDTELTRIVLSNAEFTWFFSYEGWVIASDGLTVIAHSIDELSKYMRRQSFFAGNEPNHSTGILWANIPHSEKDFISVLGLSKTL